MHCRWCLYVSYLFYLHFCQKLGKNGIHFKCALTLGNVSYHRSLHWTRNHLDSSNTVKKNHSLLQIIKHLFPKGIWHSMMYITISKLLWTYNHIGPLNRYNCWTFHIASSIHCHTSHTARTLVSSLTCSLQFSLHWRTVMNILKSAIGPLYSNPPAKKQQDALHTKPSTLYIPIFCNPCIFALVHHGL